MKTNKAELISFLEKATLGGSVMTAALVDNKIWLHSIDGTTGIFAEMKKGTGLTLPIKDTKKFINILSTFDNNDIILEMQKDKDNILKVYDSKQEGEVMLAALEYITNAETEFMEPRFTFDNTKSFVVPFDIFKKSVKNYTVASAERYSIGISNGIFFIRAGKKGFDNITMPFKIKEKVDDCIATFSEIINVILNQLEGNVTVNINSDQIMRLQFETETMKVAYYIAPLDDQEDSEKPVETKQ